MGAPTPRGRIWAPLPGFKASYGAASRKGTPEGCKWKFSQRYCSFSIPLRQIVELRMCALSHHIREGPSWWEGLKDKATVKKWREEALQQEEENDEAPSWKLTPTMVKPCYL